MTVSVDIEVARRAGTLIVAADAIHDATSAAPWVMKRSDGKARRQAVKVGARGSGEVEILAGLQAGDQVISASNANVAEGQRIRAAPADNKTTPRK
jgi:HlyD family secretion protein